MSATEIENATSHRPEAVFAASERVELAARESDSISVRLYWTRGTDVVAVTVDDAKTGDSFELVVAANERALDVFRHPFVYAHARGLELLGDTTGVGAGVEVQS